jgi:hypothetical protein
VENDRPAIRVFWWQGGLHLEPQTDEQRELLVSLCRFLELAKLGHQVHSSPAATVEFSDEQAVVAVHELPEVIP